LGIRQAEQSGLRLPDLGHAVASFAVSAGAPLYISGKALRHNHARTTERYAHLAQDPVRPAAERVAASVVVALTF